MPLEGLVSLLKDHSVFRRQAQGIGAGESPPRVSVRQGAAPAYVAALWDLRQSPTLVITPRAEDARRLHDHLLTYLGDDGPAFLLPEPEVLPFERLAVDANTSNQRLAALAALASSDRRLPGQAPPVVVASISAAMRPTLPRQVMAGRLGVTASIATPWKSASGCVCKTCWSNGWGSATATNPSSSRPAPSASAAASSTYSRPTLTCLFALSFGMTKWTPSGSSTPRASGRWAPPSGWKWSLPGSSFPGIADRRRVEDLIAGMDFSKCDREVRERIEDELVTLFSAPNVESLIFYNGLLNNASLLDYLDGDGVVVLERPSQVEDEALELEERFTNMRMAREERGELPRGFPAPFFPWLDFSASLERRPRLLLHSWLSDIEDELFQPATPYYGRLEQLAGDLRRHASRGGVTVAVTRHARRLREILEQDEIGAAITDDLQPPLNAGEVHLVNGSLSEGWVLEALSADGVSSVQLLTDSELFGTVKERRYRRSRRVETGTEITALSDLVIGSFVVHIDHGVARFAGTTTMDEDDENKEYLVLEYAENDKLYVPTDHLDRVTAYVGAQDQPPSLTRLGSADWARVKEKVKGAAREMAKELLNLHAEREVAQGHGFVQDTVWQQELEDSFPYEETPDQAAAITDVKADMEKPKPMDRLICGDVGYGKTEVALAGRLQNCQRRDAGRPAGAHHRAGPAALRHLQRTSQPLPGQRRRSEPLPHPQGAAGGDPVPQGRLPRHSHRHSPAIAKGRGVQEPGLGGGGRGAEVRRRPQGADQAAAEGGRRPDPERHSHPPYPQPSPLRHPRPQHHGHPARGSSAHQDLRFRVQRRRRQGGYSAGDGARRAGLLPAQPGQDHRAYRSGTGRVGAASPHTDRPRPDA